MNLNTIWIVLENSFDLLGDHGFAAMDKAAAEMDLKQGWMTWIAAIWLFGPEPITTVKFMRMFPYGLIHLTEESFISALRQGYLKKVGEKGYSPSITGLIAAQKVWRAAGDSLMHLDPMPEVQLRHLYEYLTRLCHASMSAPEPPPHFFISHKRENYRRMTLMNPLEHYVVLFGELAAYRDDAHISVWHAYNVEGHAWETFSYLWRGQTDTSADALIKKLGHRSIPHEVYAEDLLELVSRGWAQITAGKYQITSEGNRIREEAEALTNRLFFSPWSCLSEPELEDLKVLSTQLYAGLQKSEGE